jgi:hypothetical protein
LLQLFQQKIAETGKFTYPPFVQFMQGENNITFRILSLTKAREDICEGVDRLDELMRKNPSNLEEVEIAFRQITKGIAHIERQLQDVYDQLNQQQGKSRKKNLLTALLTATNRLVKTIDFAGKKRKTILEMQSFNDSVIQSYYEFMLEPRDPNIRQSTRKHLIELKIKAIRWEGVIHEILESQNERFSMGIRRSSLVDISKK